MRIKKVINQGTLFGYNTKFSGIANKEMYGPQLGELTFRSWEERVNSPSIVFVIKSLGHVIGKLQLGLFGERNLREKTKLLLVCGWGDKKIFFDASPLSTPV